MLDLKKLEQNLDHALTNETSESLTNWLQNKRQLAFIQSLGEGTFVNIISSCSDTVLKTHTVSFDIQFNDILVSQDYPIAS